MAIESKASKPLHPSLETKFFIGRDQASQLIPAPSLDLLGAAFLQQEQSLSEECALCLITDIFPYLRRYFWPSLGLHNASRIIPFEL